MTLSEAAELLTMAAAFDRRTIGRSDAVAWHSALANVDFTDAKTALIDHYREHTDWLMPAHITTAVRAIRTKRLAAVAEIEPPPIDPDSPVEYQRAIVAQRRAIASGQIPKWITDIADRKAIDAVPMPTNVLDTLTRPREDA